MANTIKIKRPSSYDSSSNPSSLVYGELAWANGNNKLFVGKQTDSGGAVAVYHLPTLRDLVAGDGLDVTSPSNSDGAVTLSLDLKSSGGLKISSTELMVEPANFAGDGLKDDGSDNLAIEPADFAGDGLKDDGSDNLAVDVSDFAGDGLRDAGSENLAVDVSDFAGAGLEDDGSENLRIAASAAGTGLSGGAGSALSVDYGSSAGNAAQGNTTISLTGTANEIAISGTTAQALGGGPAYTFGMPDDVTIGGVLTVTGNLLVNGTTSTVNSTTVTIDDPIFTLGGDSAGLDDSKDRGIEYKWHNGSAAKVGFFGMDDTDNKFKFIPDSSVSNEAYSGSVGSSEWNDLEASSLTGATLSSCTIDAGTY